MEKKDMDFCITISYYAKKYVEEHEFDIALIDSINCLACVLDCPYTFLLKEDLDKDIEKEEVDNKELLKLLSRFYPEYIFYYGIKDSLKRNSDIYDIKDFDFEKSKNVLIDFLNYVAKSVGENQTFKEEDLYKKYVKQHNKIKKEDKNEE